MDDIKSKTYPRHNFFDLQIFYVIGIDYRDKLSIQGPDDVWDT